MGASVWMTVTPTNVFMRPWEGNNCSFARRPSDFLNIYSHGDELIRDEDILWLLDDRTKVVHFILTGSNLF